MTLREETKQEFRRILNYQSKRLLASVKVTNSVLCINRVVLNVESKKTNNNHLWKEQTGDVNSEENLRVRYENAVGAMGATLVHSGQKFESNEEVIGATEAYFADLQKTCFSDALKTLEHLRVKRIQLKGDCAEKKIVTFPKFSFFFCRLSTYRTALVCENIR